jgi:hypothetical protein
MLPLPSRVAVGSDAARLYGKSDMYHLGGAEEISVLGNWNSAQESITKQAFSGSLYRQDMWDTNAI